MKTIYYKKLTAYIVIICFSSLKGFSASHVTFSLKNCSNLSLTTVEYDVYIVNDGTTTLKLAGCSIGVLYDPAILNGGTPGTSAHAFQVGTQDVGLTGLNSYTTNHSLSYHHLRMTMSPVIETNAPVLPANVSLRVGRFTFTNTLSWTTNSDPSFMLVMSAAAGLTLCTATTYVDGATTSTTLNQQGITTESIIDCSITLNSSVGVEEAINNSATNLYPNPFFNELNMYTDNNALSEIVLYDIASRKLVEKHFTNSVSLNTDELASGIYFYEIRNENEVVKKGKMVKQ